MTDFSNQLRDIAMRPAVSRKDRDCFRGAATKIEHLKMALARWMKHPPAECVPTQAIVMGKRALEGEDLADLDVVTRACKAETEIERLQGIVDSLPVDAEGVAIVPGRTVALRHNTVIKSGTVDLHIRGTKVYIVANVATDAILLYGEHHGTYGIAKPSDCYGSIEAAEAVKEKV
ncbi:hypothetical protein LCGC14_0248860 [marine sediment metagenome]|uniref:Uncharacterized protein n=1 Tax=marine sediment metagenome TaxID=412755 RepID=A0A0F9U9P2_9ZZZZ